MTGRLLQVLPSVIREADNELEIDIDFAESLRLYLDTFEQISIACPVTKELTDSGLRRCRPVKDFCWSNRIKLIPLPNAYGGAKFLREFCAVTRLLRHEIKRANYLVFSPHALIGDWPTVAIREAIKLGRPYVIEADVVYEKVAQAGLSRMPLWKQFTKEHLIVPLFQRCHRYSLKHSTLALLQGQDVYDAYSQYCCNPHKVYHLPISDEDYITQERLETKLQRIEQHKPLKLCYIGRAIDMKGPIDWLNTLRELIKSGVRISALWLGDGSLLPSMRTIVEDFGLADSVMLPGFISNRTQIRTFLQDSDIFLFCHKTPESPRCLVEALAAGCPLIGYESAYPKELVAERGGGEFVPIGNWVKLAGVVRNLSENRMLLRELIRSASASGRLYERDTAMQTRIDLINKYIKPVAASA